MPAMTMVFQVKEPSMLDKAKTGDKVKFTAEKIGGAYTVTRIEPTTSTMRTAVAWLSPTVARSNGVP